MSRDTDPQAAARHQGDDMTEDDYRRLVGYLTHKAHYLRAHGGSIEDVVATVVADTLLVADGSLTVDDYKP